MLKPQTKSGANFDREPDPAREAEKAEQRDRARRALADVDAEASLRAGARVAVQISQWEGWRDCGAVALYWALPGEIDTSALFGLAREAGRVALFPRMTPSQGLDFVRVDDLGALMPGRFGVREPGPEGSGERLDDAVLVLVPGLAFDRAGGRLGRGAGYYDRALAPTRGRPAGARPVVLGVGFDLQTVEHVPMDAHDVRVDGVVTETSLVWFDRA